MTSSPAGNSLGYLRVFSPQKRFALVGHEGFERAFPVNQSRHDIPVARSLAVFHHHHVAVEDVFANHGIAPHFQGEGARRGFDAQGADVNGDATLGLLLPLIRKPGRNGAKQRNVRHAAAKLLQGDNDPQRPDFARLGFNETLAFEGFQMAGRRAGAAIPEPLRDFPMGGRGPVRADFALDEFQDSALCAGGFVHILFIRIVYAVVDVNSERGRGVMRQSRMVGRAVLCPPHDGSATLIPLPMPDGGQRSARPTFPSST